MSSNLTPEEIKEIQDAEINKQYEILAACIIIQVIKDYNYIKRHEKTYKHPIIVKHLREDISKFVGSEWYHVLCTIPPSIFLQKLEEKKRVHSNISL